MGLTALITGITGQDGSYLAELLLAKGYSVYGLVRRSSSPNTQRIAHILNDVEIIEGDMTDSGSLLAALKQSHADEVYNLAGLSHVGTSFKQPESCMQVTGLGCLRLLEAISQSPGTPPRFYQASSSEIIGSLETEKYQPKSPYAAAKLYAHEITKIYRESYGLFAVAGILYNHESPRRGEQFVTRKIAQGVARIKRGEQDTIELGNIDVFRDWGYAPDYVAGMWMMLQQSQPLDHTLATGESHSVAEFARVAFKAAGIPAWRSHLIISSKFRRANEVEYLCGQATLPDWEPSISFHELVTLMVESELSC